MVVAVSSRYESLRFNPMPCNHAGLPAIGPDFCATQLHLCFVSLWGLARGGHVHLLLHFLGVEGGSTANGARIIQWYQSYTQNQRFSIIRRRM
jgi:hypothetical protein